ncbi:MAG: hypothetical protein HY051_05855, partial [Candidatus Aenigmarchaeota archaeon]|nr:hypothetical protein [Candidatus Aenigmarchaeota archaeon]
KYGSVGNLASTGGWTLAKGEAMEHFNKLELVKLNTGQQAVFEEVAKTGLVATGRGARSYSRRFAA